MRISIKPETASDLTALVLRISTAFMILHGWDKLADFSVNAVDFPDPLHIGAKASLCLTIFAELFCAVFVLVGFFTRIASLPLIICMTVIIFVIDAGEPLADRELAVIYLLLYIAICIIGPGKYSLDNLIRKVK